MKKRIGHQQVAFLRFELERGEPRRKKIALQDLCSFYRKGFALAAEDAESFGSQINGIILHDNQDPKVVRWCLNALAQFGRLEQSRAYVEAALLRYRGNPEIEAAGVAALCKMFGGSVADIEALQHIDPVVWKLAALQNTPPERIEGLSALSIDIYKADAAVLRLALITVGLNRDIQNLFHPKHSNGNFVRHLGQHGDDVVQQYSVWSVIENKKLEFTDLGIPLDGIQKVRPNVQSKLYQLVAERDPDLRRRLSIISRGASVASSDAREGLAKGVRRNYFDGLEGVTTDWFVREPNAAVRGLLAEHFAFFSEDCAAYNELAMDTYELEEGLRDRLLLGAEGLPLFSKLRGHTGPDLFSSVRAPNDLAEQIRNRTSSGKASGRLTVLMLMVSPLGQQRVRIDKELREIHAQISNLVDPLVSVQPLLEMAVRAKDLLTKIHNARADVLHFSGHAEQGRLVFEDEDGNAQLVDGEVLARYLQGAGTSLACIVLNACYTESLAEKLLPFTRFLIGCSAAIDDEAAVLFSSAFYQSLAAGRSFEQSFNLAKEHVKLAGYVKEAAKYVFKAR